MFLILSVCCFSSAVRGQKPWTSTDGSFLADAQNEVQPVSRGVGAYWRPDRKPQVTDFTVKSTIVSRYAFTAVSCTVVNRASVPSDAGFQMQIPASAFISNFTMVIGGAVHQGQVKAKARKPKGRKRKEHSRRNESGEREVEIFSVALKLPAKTKATFLLSYEELLERRMGMYEHVISIRPRQIVPKLRVDINLMESSGISFLEIPPLRKSRVRGSSPSVKASRPPSTSVNRTKTAASVRFSPSVLQQARIAESGVLGDFILRYDVDRELGAGDIQVQNGYFIHHFAPKDLPPVPKNVVFVIDTSASMLGMKMKQTKDALFTILNDLRPNDRFNVINFSNHVRVWRRGKLVPVTRENLREAKKYIYLMSPSGGTNINDAVQAGAGLLKGSAAEGEESRRAVSLIIFLTDGRPTISEVRPHKILSNTKEAIGDGLCLFTLGVGKDVDYRLLERMSLDNCGAMRRVYEGLDAGEQLKGFYDEIGTPLLSDIRVEYSEASVSDVTQSFFANYFNGSEVVIAGKVASGRGKHLHVQVTASAGDRRITMEADAEVGEAGQEGREPRGDDPGRDMVRRAWSYLTLKGLLRKHLTSGRGGGGEEEEERLRDRAGNLSVEYGFVSPLAAMELPSLEGDDRRPDGPSRSPGGAAEDQVKASGEGGRMQSSSGRNKPEVQFARSKKTVVISKTSADGDPHFVVDFPRSETSVCFNFDGEPGEVLRLLSDRRNSGPLLTVNGQLIGAPAPPGGHKKRRTYFSAVAVVTGEPSRRSYIEITPRKVVFDGKDRMVLSCDRTVEVEGRGMVVSVEARSSVTVTINDSISLLILIHRYKNPAAHQRDHLGFYILNSSGLSPRAHGLLGQFLNTEVKVKGTTTNTTGSKVQSVEEGARTPGGEGTRELEATLDIKGRLVPVAMRQRRIYNGQQLVDCWFARDNAAGLIDGSYKDYLAGHLFDTGTGNSVDL
ncbi:inter-alpha-trypsin inhibitor heavy chain H5 [Callorhinchus milii]|uniref:inter-alpha-trypsin inhibitor heavy chain H5 n=1 Tax=Callorhinchus milii TaxID=7868 RepID=UPI001C3FB933|nr:inter-alpha-trypsin inhibitor heavy chain H5 [Callorhinchus milii]